MTTPAQPADLVTWLRWVLDQREAEARLLCALAGVTDTGTWLGTLLAEVDAKRRILDLHAVRSDTGGDSDTDPPAVCNECSDLHPCGTVQLLALPHAGRPGYRSEWASA